MPFRRSQQEYASQRGFTLIEVAIGLAIIGLLAVPYIEIYRAYQVKLASTQTQDNIALVKSSLNKFAVRNGRYPIPANQSLALGSGLDGGESLPAGITNCLLNSTTACRVITAWSGPTAADNKILIGAVPYAAIGLPQRYALDGYGNKLTYAVTEQMTGTAYGPSFNNLDGIVHLVDRVGAEPPGTTVDIIPAPSPPASASRPNIHYLVVSHGLDGNGAFTPNGVQVSACRTGAAASKDDMNCDNDGTFNNNYETINGIYDRRQYTPNDTEHYDDRLGYVTTLEQGLWIQRSSSTDIYIPPLNTNNVLVAPIPATDVSGNAIVPTSRVEVRGGNMRMTQLLTDRLCDYTDGCDLWQAASCANAGGACTFSGSRLVLFGPSTTSTQIKVQSFTGSAPCTIAAFGGDPAVGVTKKCWLQNVPASTEVPPSTFSPQSIGGIPDAVQGGNKGYGILCKQVSATEAQVMTGVSDSDEQCYNIVPASLNIGSCAAGYVSHGIDAAGKLICEIN